jgi:RNA polymerase sigma-70 factor (ECF subfamily)
MLGQLLPEDSETAGLLALMLLHQARAPGRLTPDGLPASLAEQDRACWDRNLIAEGVALLESAMLRRSPGPYQLQAAIAALHVQAPSFDRTDWLQIALLYGELTRQTPSAVVEINRAVAIGMADGPHAGLAILAPLLSAGTFDDYGPLHAAHADLLDRAGAPDAALGAWERAIAATQNPQLRAALHRRVDARSGAGSPDSENSSR